MLEVVLEAAVLLLVGRLLPQTLDILPGLKVLLTLHVQLEFDVFEFFGNHTAVLMRR